MGQFTIPDGPLSTATRLLGLEEQTNHVEVSLKIIFSVQEFLIFLPCKTKKISPSLWAPMGPPVAVGPRKNFQVSHPVSGPALK